MTVLEFRDMFLSPEEYEKKKEQIEKEDEDRRRINAKYYELEVKRRKKEENRIRKIERQAIEKNIKEHFDIIMKKYSVND